MVDLPAAGRRALPPLKVAFFEALFTYPGGGMVDALVSNTSDASRAGSSPALGTFMNGSRAGLRTAGLATVGKFESRLGFYFLHGLLDICDH